MNVTMDNHIVPIYSIGAAGNYHRGGVPIESLYTWGGYKSPHALDKIYIQSSEIGQRTGAILCSNRHTKLHSTGVL